MLDNVSKITTQMRKGILEYVILAIIKKWDAYASDILDCLKTNKLIVVEWTLYPLLSRLKSDWLISYFWVESKSWPPRKYYKLTNSWQEIFQIMDSSWHNLSNSVNNIIITK